MVLWLRFHIPKAGTRVQSLVRETDPTCHNLKKKILYAATKTWHRQIIFFFLSGITPLAQCLVCSRCSVNAWFFFFCHRHCSAGFRSQEEGTVGGRWPLIEPGRQREACRWGWLWGGTCVWGPTTIHFLCPAPCASQVTLSGSRWGSSWHPSFSQGLRNRLVHGQPNNQMALGLAESCALS